MNRLATPIFLCLLATIFTDASNGQPVSIRLEFSGQFPSGKDEIVIYHRLSDKSAWKEETVKKQDSNTAFKYATSITPTGVASVKVGVRDPGLLKADKVEMYNLDGQTRGITIGGSLSIAKINLKAGDSARGRFQFNKGHKDSSLIELRAYSGNGLVQASNNSSALPNPPKDNGQSPQPNNHRAEIPLLVVPVAQLNPQSHLLVEISAEDLSAEGGNSGELTLLIIESSPNPKTRYSFKTLIDNPSPWYRFKSTPNSTPFAVSLTKKLELSDLEKFEARLADGGSPYRPRISLPPLPLAGELNSRRFHVVAFEQGIAAFKTSKKDSIVEEWRIDKEFKTCTAHTIEEFQRQIKAAFTAEDPDLVHFLSTPQQVELKLGAAKTIPLKGPNGYHYNLRLELSGSPERLDFREQRGRVSAILPVQEGNPESFFAPGKTLSPANHDLAKLVEYLKFLKKLAPSRRVIAMGESAELLEWKYDPESGADRIAYDIFETYRQHGELSIVDPSGNIIGRDGDSDKESQEPVIGQSAVATLAMQIGQGVVDPNDGEALATLADELQKAVKNLDFVFTPAASSQSMRLGIDDEGKLNSGLSLKEFNKRGKLTLSPSVAPISKVLNLNLANGTIEANFDHLPETVDKQGDPLNLEKDKLSVSNFDGRPIDQTILQRSIFVHGLLKRPVTVESPYFETQTLTPIVRTDSILLPLSGASAKGFKFDVVLETEHGNIPMASETDRWNIFVKQKGNNPLVALELTDQELSLRKLAHNGVEDRANITSMEIHPASSSIYGEIKIPDEVVDQFRNEKFLIRNLKSLTIQLKESDALKKVSIRPETFHGLFPAVYLKTTNEKEYVFLTSHAKNPIFVRGKERRRFKTDNEVWLWDPKNKRHTHIQSGEVNLTPLEISEIYPLDSKLPQIGGRPGLVSIPPIYHSPSLQSIKANLKKWYSAFDPGAEPSHSNNIHNLLSRGRDGGHFAIEFFFKEEVEKLYLTPLSKALGAIEMEKSESSNKVHRHVIRSEREFVDLMKGFQVTTSPDGTETIPALVTRTENGFEEPRIFDFTQRQEHLFVSAWDEFTDLNISTGASSATMTINGGSRTNEITAKKLNVVIINERRDVNYLTLHIRDIYKIIGKFAEKAKYTGQVQFFVVAESSSGPRVYSGTSQTFTADPIPSKPQPDVSLSRVKYGAERLKIATNLIEGSDPAILDGNTLYIVDLEPPSNAAGLEERYRSEDPTRHLMVIRPGELENRAESLESLLETLLKN